MSKTLVVLSGGQDSTTCLYWALNHKHQVETVTFDYGQLHWSEIEAAEKIAKHAGVPNEVVCLGGDMLAGTSPLTNRAVKLEQYDDKNALPGGLEKTFVPYRNQLFLTIAANRAHVKGISSMITGVCQEDFGGYPDCRRVFIDALEQACSLGSHTGREGCPGPLKIHTPLMDLTKAQSIDLALRLPGCYEALKWTQTSYDGAYPPTGKDHATQLRAKGFEEACVPDPLVLRAFSEGLMDLPDAVNYAPDMVIPYFEEAKIDMPKPVKQTGRKRTAKK